MTPVPKLEDRLRTALRRPDSFPWPDERGAFDQFRRGRARRGRSLAVRAGVAVIAVVALAAATPRLLPSRPAGPATPPGRVVSALAGGFEVTVPAGWTDLSRDRRIWFTGKDTGSGVGLRPMRRAPDTIVTIYTAILRPAQYPGTEPGGGDPAPSVSADRATLRGPAPPPTGPRFGWTTTRVPSAGVAGGTAGRTSGRPGWRRTRWPGTRSPGRTTAPRTRRAHRVPAGGP